MDLHNGDIGRSARLRPQELSPRAGLLTPTSDATLPELGDYMPRVAKAHSEQLARELVRLGWTLRLEFLAEGDDQPYEYVFAWEHDGEPAKPTDDPKAWLGSGKLPEPLDGRRVNGRPQRPPWVDFRHRLRSRQRT